MEYLRMGIFLGHVRLNVMHYNQNYEREVRITNYFCKIGKNKNCIIFT